MTIEFFFLVRGISTEKNEKREFSRVTASFLQSLYRKGWKYYWVVDKIKKQTLLSFHLVLRYDTYTSPIRGQTTMEIDGKKVVTVSLTRIPRSSCCCVPSRAQFSFNLFFLFFCLFSILNETQGTDHRWCVVCSGANQVQADSFHLFFHFVRPGQKLLKDSQNHQIAAHTLTSLSAIFSFFKNTIPLKSI